MTAVPGSSRFPKTRRLLSRADFDRVQNGDQTRRASSAHFLVLLAPRTQDGAVTSRLGIIASRRVGSAVRRNRAKRLIREFFRTTDGPGGFDMVVVVKTGAETLTQAAADAELSAVTARAVKAAPSKPAPRPPRRAPAKKGAK